MTWTRSNESRNASSRTRWKGGDEKDRHHFGSGMPRLWVRLMGAVGVELFLAFFPEEFSWKFRFVGGRLRYEWAMKVHCKSFGSSGRCVADGGS